MDERRKEKVIPIAIGIGFVCLLAAILYSSPKPLVEILEYLENISYDLKVRYEQNPVDKDVPIVIVDLDDRSLIEEGRWPWNRKKMGSLVSTLYSLGAKVIAMDLMFPEPEENIAETVIQALKKDESSAIITELEGLKSSFNNDAMFAKSLSEGNTVLGFVFKREGKPSGELPPPVFLLTSAMEGWVEIPNMQSYISNISVLQGASKSGGFINSSIDQDGVIRFTPMLLRQGHKVYPSLSLAAVKLFLGVAELSLIGEEYGDIDVLEGIQLGNTRIPTDPWGRVLIPFRGMPYSVPYVSATDVLKGVVPREAIQNKLIFVGSSATAVGDLVATSIAPVFAGIEIHAQTASGILDGYLPYKPAWGKGASIFLILLLGSILSFVLPFLGPLVSSFLTFAVIFLVIVLDHYIWKKLGIDISVIYPIFSLLVVYVMNEICSYVFDSRRRKLMKSVFGQYVPPDCIDSMLKKSGDYGLEGETKDLSVLFSDIRGFTTISESMSASDLKEFLNTYLGQMTETIFETKGTIDKYVGDMIIAFWGAPINDLQHPEHAVLAAFAMQKKLDAINLNFHKVGMPVIRIGIGVNSGAMNVGDMGSKFRRAYTVLGDAVNLGSRLEGLTKYYHVKILVGESTYEKTASLFVYRQIDRVKVKGKMIGINIYEPIGLKGAVSADVLATLEMHKQAFDAYQHQKWDEAGLLFTQIKEKDLNKELYDIYLSRVAEYKKNPPPEGWDGTYTLESK